MLVERLHDDGLAERGLACRGAEARLEEEGGVVNAAHLWFIQSVLRGVGLGDEGVLVDHLLVFLIMFHYPKESSLE